ncbi:MAG: hypothetical protein HOV83_16010, partial [Catenulispora sp.]|nr:hypothetical protein [Catenulispora sp.]
MATHLIRTTLRPDVQITVDDAEYESLLELGLVYDGTPPVEPADMFDLLFADKVENGVALPAALRAAYAPRANTFIPLGDSLTNNGSTSYDATSQGLGNPLVGYSVRGYWVWASVLLGHRLKLIRNAGISGETAEQILTRVDADVIAYSPGWCIVEAGRNSVSAGTSSATIIATLTSIYNKLLAAGIRVVATTITPRDTDTTADLLVLFTVNSWMKEYVRTRPGMVLADMHAAVADPTTGDWLSGYSFDGLHPGALGGRKMGPVLADALDPLVPKADLLVASNADATNLVPNGLCTGTGGAVGTGVTGSVATNWRVDGTSTITATASKVARTDGKPGEWQQINVASLAANNQARFRQTVALGGDVAIGNTVVA